MHWAFLYTLCIILAVTLKGVGGPCLHFFPHIEWFLFARHLGYSDEASVIYSDEMKRYKGSKSLSNLS